MESIFISTEGLSPTGIVRKIANDIQTETTKLGYKCRCGNIADYGGEDICYHMVAILAIPIKEAKHNSVFFTHVNEKMTESFVASIKDKFDSFVCMSEEDVEYLIELGFDKKKVFGKTLPIRNSFIKPITIGIFSACYDDGRKNEQWLIDYCSQNAAAQLANFMFVGPGWERVVKALETSDCSFEWHCVSPKMPYEYQFQQLKLEKMNYYIYMGMDGGALGTYDAYAQDVPLCVTFDGFHKAIPNIDYTFDNKETFFAQMDIIIGKHSARLKFFADNTTLNYSKWISRVWEGKQDYSIEEESKKCISYNNVLEKKRAQYYKLNFVRVRNFLRHTFRRFKTKRKLGL